VLVRVSLDMHRSVIPLDTVHTDRVRGWMQSPIRSAGCRPSRRPARWVPRAACRRRVRA
jgi:hypothetical protein